MGLNVSSQIWTFISSEMGHHEWVMTYTFQNINSRDAQSLRWGEQQGKAITGLLKERREEMAAA